MKMITYLFGAGASREVLPIVNEMPDRINQMCEFLSTPKYQLSEVESFPDINSTATKRQLQNDLVQDLHWVQKASRNHASVDTFAKKLFIKQDYYNLNRLKAALSAFLVLEQARNGVDKRYDGFFASIVNDSISNLPSNVRILSWNYDLQFETAFSEYTEREDISHNQSYLRTKRKFSRDGSNHDNFAVYKINGDAGIYSDKGIRHFNLHNKVNSKLDLPIISDVVRNTALLKLTANQFFPSISFAWENDHNETTIISKSVQGTSKTSVLVVIGYSFPFFNRVVDRQIIGEMKNLEKVYFQAPDANLIKERFLSIREDIDDNKLIPRFDIEQFLLPNEL
jgi:hypothetical protein